MIENIFLAGSYVPSDLGASAADANGVSALIGALLIFVLGLLVGLE